MEDGALCLPKQQLAQDALWAVWYGAAADPKVRDSACWSIAELESCMMYMAGINWRLLYDWKTEQRAEKMRRTGAMLREMQQREENNRHAHTVQASRQSSFFKVAIRP